MNEPPKVVPLAPRPSEFEAAGEVLRKNEETLRENMEVVARLQFARYLALRKAGFSEKEALELCTK